MGERREQIAMGGDHRLEVEKHLSEEDLDRLLNQTDDEKVSNGSPSSNASTKVLHRQKRLTTLGNQNQRATGGFTAGMRADSVSSRRTSGTAGPRSSTRISNRSFWNFSATDNRGNHRRSNSCFSTNSTLSTIQIILENSSVTSVSPTRNHGQSDPADQRILTRFSKSASTTRSRRTITLTTNAKEKTKTAGLLMKMFVLMEEL